MKLIKNMRIYVLIITVILTISWSVFCVVQLVKSNNENNKIVNEKPVDSSNIEEKYLDNDLNVSFIDKDTNEETIMPLKDVKDKYSIDGDITKEELNKVLKNEGYIEDNEITVNNEVFYKQLIKPRKYYIREYNGYLAIYRSNDKCQLAIEDEDADIYQNAIMYKNFSDVDKDYFESYKAEFDSKDEARDYMTQFIS